MRQVFGALKSVLSSNGGIERALASLAEHLRVRHVLGVSSGRAALWLILRSLQRLRPGRSVVALPAYTCFSVPAAVVRAGLKLHPLEMDPETLDFDFTQLDALPDEDLLCIITSNLFGLVNDLPRIRQAAQAKGAFVLDDAAQALGAKRHGRFAGTLGDVGVYSLGRGKAVAAIEGGLIVTNSEAIARALKEEAKNLKTPTMLHGAWLLFEMVAYAILLRPPFYWIPNALPFLHLGTTEFNPAFPTDELHGLCRELLPRLLGRLEEINQIRSAHARALVDACANHPDFTFPKPATNSHPTFVRLPVIARNPAIRQRAVSRLLGAGIGASTFYPSAICDIQGIEKHMSAREFHRERAEHLSERLFTLPVHPYVRPQDRERMIHILAALREDDRA